MGARHQESRDRSPWHLRHPRDDTALLDRPLRGRGHRSATLSQVFKTQSRSQLLRCSNGGAARAFTRQRPHRYEGGTGFEVHVRSKAPDVLDRPTQREKRVKVQAKQLKHMKMKNEYEIVMQTLLPQQSANSSKDLHVYQKVARANLKRKKVKAAAESWRFSDPTRGARRVRQRHGGWNRN